MKRSTMLCRQERDEAVGRMLDPSGAGVRIALQRDTAHTVKATLAFQRRFRFNSARLRSISYEMRPDITLESGGRLLVLDPKYRIGHDGVIDGLGAMHRYCDAIVGPAGGRAVAGAYLLCPAPPATASDEQRYLGDAYQAEWGMGICVLRPGGGTDRVRGDHRELSLQSIDFVIPLLQLGFQRSDLPVRDRLCALSST